MKLTESKLRKVIRSVILEMNEAPLRFNMSMAPKINVRVGDTVQIMKLTDDVANSLSDFNAGDNISDLEGAFAQVIQMFPESNTCTLYVEESRNGAGDDRTLKNIPCTRQFIVPA